MKTVTIRELHARTGELVRTAKHHGEILITDNGRPIARILPQLEAVTPYFARRKSSAAFRKLDASGKTGGGTDVSQLISEERADRV